MRRATGHRAVRGGTRSPGGARRQGAAASGAGAAGSTGGGRRGAAVPARRTGGRTARRGRRSRTRSPGSGSPGTPGRPATPWTAWTARLGGMPWPPRSVAPPQPGTSRAEPGAPLRSAAPWPPLCPGVLSCPSTGGANPQEERGEGGAAQRPKAVPSVRGGLWSTSCGAGPTALARWRQPGRDAGRALLPEPCGDIPAPHHRKVGQSPEAAPSEGPDEAPSGPARQPGGSQAPRVHVGGPVRAG